MRMNVKSCLFGRALSSANIGSMGRKEEVHNNATLCG